MGCGFIWRDLATRADAIIMGIRTALESR